MHCGESAVDTTDLGFVNHWRIVGPILQRLERDELRHYTDADRRRDIQALLDVPIRFRPAKTSGLVVQQQLFRRCQP
jgi:hypothetical protein